MIWSSDFPEQGKEDVEGFDGCLQSQLSYSTILQAMLCEHHRRRFQEDIQPSRISGMQ